MSRLLQRFVGSVALNRCMYVGDDISFQRGEGVGGGRVFPVHNSANAYEICVKFLRTKKLTFLLPSLYGKLRLLLRDLK